MTILFKGSSGKESAPSDILFIAYGAKSVKPVPLLTGILKNCKTKLKYADYFYLLACLCIHMHFEMIILFLMFVFLCYYYHEQ